MIRAGLQIPNFTYAGVTPEQLFEKVAAIAVAGEEAGFDTVMVMDHFYQLPMLGAPEQEMFEAYTLLGALAARTKKVNLGTLVTGVTYRNPAILAKIVTTLDVISQGRAFLGIGAAWFDLEHDALGVEFPSVSERFERLEEALQICRAMFKGERLTFEGAHYRVKDVVNSPASIRGDIPIMIGGQGEKKTMRIAAQYAEMVNLTAPPDEIPRKLEALAKHCADLGRDMAAINKTCLGTLILGRTQEEAEAKRNAFLGSRGMDWDTLDDGMRTMLSARLFIGGPDQVAEQMQGLRELGLDGITVNLPADGADVDAVGLAGEVLTAAWA
jgi:F420-dependent oxidoreductase-like protein